MADVPLRPQGVNFYGFFHTPSSTVDSDDSWTNFSLSDFTNQIDAAASIGANFYVFFGAITTVHNGQSQATFLANRRKVFDYLYKKNMYFLPYFGYTFSGWGTGPITNAEIVPLMAADAAIASQYPNCIGYCCTDEPYLGSATAGQVVSFVGDQYNACKAVVPTGFPICGATLPASTLTGYLASPANVDNLMPYCDFVAYHPFSAALVTITDFQAAYPNKEVIMPSTIDAQDGDSNLSATVSATMGAVGSNKNRGMAWFLLKDFGDTVGMYNTSLVIKAAKQTQWNANLPATRFPRRMTKLNRGKPRQAAYQQWGY